MTMEILGPEALIHGSSCSSGEGFDITIQLLVKLRTQSTRTEKRKDDRGQEYEFHPYDERELSEDEQKLCRHAMYDLEKALYAAIIKTTPATIASQKAWRADLPALFEKAGLLPIYIEEIPNEYTTEGWETPWALVTTSFGHIKIGWRKRVLLIDWSRTRIEKSGAELFPNETVTKGGGAGEYKREQYSYIHAWGYEKAVEYLKCLKAAAEG